ncbi:hypothetical protein [Lactiplantibacillus fabifermentans]|uniref:Uncharacterized protein n=1 Tax=Lactiplantibacillus fabifermentans T30PCM01 TaxID=1400520 RepID=W6T545_9LACO|nr:hypothetical protein [Lactiplantibacillus fabifermentans]ETY73092.1 hypothetical protein LFAB_14200 [Lactiplantibacillus fabifermentans T30PCM01]
MEVAVQVVLMPVIFRHLQHRHLWRLAGWVKLQSEVRDRFSGSNWSPRLLELLLTGSGNKEQV